MIFFSSHIPILLEVPHEKSLMKKKNRNNIIIHLKIKMAIFISHLQEKITLIVNTIKVININKKKQLNNIMFMNIFFLNI